MKELGGKIFALKIAGNCFNKKMEKFSFTRRESDRITPIVTKQTPFVTTNNRRIRNKLPQVVTSQRKGVEIETSELLNKTWDAHSCSPLHGFHENTASLDCYGRSLSAVLVASKSKNIGVEVVDSSVTSVTFKLVHGIYGIHNGLKFQVLTKSGKIIFESFLFSSEQSLSSDVIMASSKLTMLPLLVCRGDRSTTKVVFDWLKTEFDCSLRKITFNPLSLGWLVAMWGSVKGQGSTHITWEIPMVETGIDIIESEIDGESVALLWKHAHEDSTMEVTIDEVRGFVASIEEHLTQHTKILFNALTMQQIKTPVIQVRNDGKFKVTSGDHLFHVMADVATLALEHLDHYTPTM
uniref:centromere protein L-like isoform X1 n=1 Tax=Ciona intestinalis TaxID=7719 RepID=UPI0002B8E307|nr:centromere protein L-like isoform X1 [Ciona intestinalis]|eukprot:XP_002122642.2 centromere protein L-like isoform X1 [Ciona intestinalis]